MVPNPTPNPAPTQATPASGFPTHGAPAPTQATPAAGFPTQATPAAGAPVLECQNLEKYFGSTSAVTKALDGVSFSLARGEFTAIMGPSGSGKTTLLNCLSTIDSPTAGHVFINGQDVTRLRSRELARFRREQLGFIFQDANLLESLTIGENIALALSITGGKNIDGRVNDVARELGIAEILTHFPAQVSGGQRQRAAAARAIITHPSLILADEPTGALDSRNSRTLLECLAALNRAHQASILMVTHDAYAASWAHRLIVLKDGRLFTQIYRGEKTREEFFNDIMAVVSFLGGEGSHVAQH